MSYGLSVQDETGKELFNVDEGRWLALETGIINKNSVDNIVFNRSNYPDFTYLAVYIGTYNYKDMISGGKTAYWGSTSSSVTIYSNSNDVAHYYILLGR